MIVAEQKPLAEIKKMVEPYRKLLILGCGTCVKTCFAGGEDEVAALASELRLAFKIDGKAVEIEEQTVERQCEDEFIHEAAEAAARNDAVLSLACSVGVQDIARRYGTTICLPGLNTTFLGAMEGKGYFTEECSGCGNCIIGDFGAICPVTKCAKKLLNGPCGGSREGICEVNPDTQCAWQLIIDRLTAIGQLDNLKKIYPAKDWRTDTSGGPRKLLREDLVI